MAPPWYTKDMKHIDYRDFLFEELESRKLRNNRYSLRSFADSLGVPAPRLSQILNKKTGLSALKAKEIGFRLGLSETEREVFVTLVESEHARSPILKARAIKKLESWADENSPLINLEKFSIIRNWYHYSILELTELDSFQSKPEWISKKLGIEIELVESAIDRLVNLELLSYEGDALIQTYKDLGTVSGEASRALREHHKQIMNNVVSKIDATPLKERCLSSTTMAIDSSKLEEAKKYIKEFRDKFCKEIQDTETKDEVYSLSIQFFPTTETENENI